MHQVIRVGVPWFRVCRVGQQVAAAVFGIIKLLGGSKDSGAQGEPRLYYPRPVS